MPLEPEHQLGPYKIQALLGVGGMGEVYRGHDTRLGRDVALKVISPRLVGDPSLRRRFELEARAASALNHPAIVTVYDVGDTDGVSWIAMEWVEGRTLRQVLSDGPVAIRDAWSIARQIADGLTAAHAKGIIHRDLKPENVMVLADGRAKILDFGRARQTLVDALEGSSSTAGTMAAQTIEAASGPTVGGVILGTVGYMSPEQASGRALDFRSDQFAFGLIAYEMLTGRRAFLRPTAVETLSAIIRVRDPGPCQGIRVRGSGWRPGRVRSENGPYVANPSYPPTRGVRLNVELPSFKLTRRQVLIDRLFHDPKVQAAAAARAGDERRLPRAQPLVRAHQPLAPFRLCPC